MELVSVVVPIYKVEKYLDKCIKSILDQTWENLEIILVDDGSPDQCGVLCDRYAAEDSRIKVIHKENGGLSDARNAGVRLASGKYLLFVDSDDYIAKDLVEKTVGIAEKTNCDIALFDYYYVENGVEEVRTCDIPSKKELCLEEEKGLLMIPPSAWTKLFNRDFYMRAGCFFPKGLYYEDLATTPKLLYQAEKIVYLKEPLYYYMIRSNSIMGSRNYKKNFEDKVKVLDSILQYYKENGGYRQYREELEYLVFANVFFEPSKEIILSGTGMDYLEKFRNYMYRRFPDFRKNQYIKQMGKKNRLHMYILITKQYWLMRVLSKCRQAAEKIKR